MNLNKIAARLGYLAAGLFGLILVVVAGALGCRVVAQGSIVRSRAIDAAQGVDELTKVRIGGLDQRIHIRGENVANPILL